MLESSGVATVGRALISQQCGLGLILRLGVMWVEFVGSLLFSERFFPGYSSGIARIFQLGGRGGHTMSNRGYSPDCHDVDLHAMLYALLHFSDE